MCQVMWQFQRQSFFCCRTYNLERFATGTWTHGHQLWAIQKHAEIVSLYIGFSQPRRIVTFLIIAPKLSYLLTYSQIDGE